MANKSGKPKDDYPNFETKMQVKSAHVRDNRFSVIFTDTAVVSASDPVQQQSAPATAPTHVI